MLSGTKHLDSSACLPTQMLRSAQHDSLDGPFKLDSALQKGVIMQRRGVNYDAGEVLEGFSMRPAFDAKVVHRELEIIKNDLHCNAVKICGLDIDRLMSSAEDALRQGMEVWLAPRMFERSEQDTFDYIVECAQAAERLRRSWPQLVFVLGCELTLFMQGILEGNSLMERIGHPSFWENVKTGTHNQRLNAFLTRTNKAIRQVFRGNVTYASAPLESVDWSLFDFICVDIYRDARSKHVMGEILKRYFVSNKPVVIGEFGCCTYQGAEDAGAMGWAICDYSANSLRLNGDYVRDEGVQAREITEMLELFEGAGVDGAFVFTFITPTLPYNKDPRSDLDMASYSLVKSYADTHGTAYPDMLWEPKASFKAVADYFAQYQIGEHEGGANESPTA